MPHEQNIDCTLAPHCDRPQAHQVVSDLEAQIMSTPEPILKRKENGHMATRLTALQDFFSQHGPIVVS